MKSTWLFALGLFCSVAFVSQTWAAKAPQPILLWPNGAPGQTNNGSAETNTSTPGKGLVAGKSVIRLGNVSQPTITVYQPSKSKRNGAAVVICPGGAYSILAYDLEGTEVCEWLKSKGVAAALLKYRVPRKDAAPLQDAQRALGLVRFRAKEFGIDPQRIGILGFSAGGNLAAKLSANNAQRTYPVQDAGDNVSCRPDFQLLIYPAYLTTTNAPEKLVAEVAVTSNTPPTFLVMAADDPVRVDNVLVYAHAMREARMPVELHVYATGGHGYGLRRTKEPITEWPELATAWMENRGLLKRQ
jgi:acetyl esterase/lipase